MTDSLYRGTGGHNYIQDEDMETSFIKQQQEEARIDWGLKIGPKSNQRDQNRILDTLTAQIIKNTFTEALRIIDEHDPNKSMARKTSSAYWGNTLRKEIEDIINNITKV